MNISFINDEFSENIEECISFCLENKIDFIELRKINGKNISDLSNDQIKDVFDSLNRHNIKISCLDSGILKKDNFPFLTHDDEEQINCAINRAISIAKILKTTNIRIFSGVKTPDFSFEKLALFLSDKKDLLEGAKINLMIENEKNCNIAKISELKCFFEKFKLSRIYPLIDLGNAIRAGENDIFEQCTLMKNVCRYYHIKDMSTEKKYCAIGNGIFNFDYIKNIADEASFFSLEPATKNKNDMKISVRYMKRIV